MNVRFLAYAVGLLFLYVLATDPEAFETAALLVFGLFNRI